MVCASARGVRRHMSCSSWAPEDDFGLRRLEHELVAIEREANHVMTLLAVLAVLVKHLPESP